MRALLLAAGIGSRLRPLTDTIPKCLAPINGRPLLDYWIELLSSAGLRDLLLNVHYLPDAVRSYIRTCKFDVNIEIAYEEALLGTGGTLLKNMAYFRGEDAILIHADNLSYFDVQAFIRSHQQRPAGTEITMMTFITPDPSSCGIVEVDDRGVVLAFHEKVSPPVGDLANSAVYIVSPAVIDYLASLGREIIDFSTDVLPRFLGRINTFHNNIYHRDIGTPASLAAAQQEYRAALAARAPSSGE
jgi:mannose-1-phosphate guanylyltransferase